MIFNDITTGSTTTITSTNSIIAHQKMVSIDLACEIENYG